MKYLMPLYILALLLMTGCGHVITTYSKGVGLEIAWSTDTIMPAVRMGTYENVDVAQKENTQVRYTSNTGLGFDMFGIGKIVSLFGGKQDESDIGIGTVLEVKSGPMTTGYVADVLQNPNVKQEHVEIAKAMCLVNNSLGDKETHVGLAGAKTNVTPVVVTEKGILGNSTVTTPANQYTVDAIKKQVSPVGLFDVIKSFGFYIVAGIVLLFLILAFVVVHMMQRIGELKEIIKAGKDIVGDVKDMVKD